MRKNRSEWQRDTDFLRAHCSEQQIEMTDSDYKRNELLKQGQEYLSEQAVHGFLFQLPKLSIVKAGVEGFWPDSPVLFQPLADVRVTD